MGDISLKAFIWSYWTTGPIVAVPGSASRNTFQCMQFLLFYLCFIPGHSFTSRTPNKDHRWSNSSTFHWFKSHSLETSMSSAVNSFVHAIRKYSQKCLKLVQKVASFGSLGPIPMIQPHSIALVLLYNINLELSFSIKQFQSYMLLNTGAKITFQHVNLIIQSTIL